MTNSKKLYCVIQPTSNKVIFWGSGHNKKSALADAHTEVESYCACTGESAEQISAELITVLADEKVLSIIATIVQHNHPAEDFRFRLAGKGQKMVLQVDALEEKPSEVELPKHSKACAYKGDFWTDCTCAAKFNGKPFKHWQEQAREMLMDHFLRAAVGNDHRSIVGVLVRARLVELANAESPEGFQRVQAQRDNWIAGLAEFMSQFGG